MNRLNSQRGSTGVPNPDDSRPEKEQLRAALEERLAERVGQCRAARAVGPTVNRAARSG